MRKKILYLLLIVFFSFFLMSNTCLAKIFNEQTSPVNENANDIPDPLKQYQAEPTIKNFAQKTAGEWQKINEKGSAFWAKNFEPYFGGYLKTIKENIKQGWAEEKQEYRQDFFKALGRVWEKIKNKLFHKQGSEQ